MVVLFTPHLFFFPLIYLVAIVEAHYLLKLRIISKTLLLFLLSISTVLSVSFATNGVISKEIVRQIIVFAILFLAIRRIYIRDGERTFLKYIMGLLGIQCLLILCSAYIEGFAVQFHEFFTLTEKGYRHIGENVLVNRYSGFAPSGFSFLSAYMALLGIIIIQDVNIRKHHKFILFLVLVVAIFSVGRTGLILLSVFLMLEAFKKNKAFIALCIPISFIILPYIKGLEFPYGTLLNFVLDPLVNGFESVTLKALITNEWYLPEIYLFGDGLFFRSEGGELSDVGLVKYLGAIGPIMLFLLMIVFLGFFFWGVRKDKLGIVITFSIFWLLLNFKDFYFVSSGYVQAFIIVWLLTRQRHLIGSRE